MVRGSVRITKTGLTNNLRSARTTATIIAVQKLATEIPGRISAKTITARAVNSNLRMSFITRYFEF